MAEDVGGNAGFYFDQAQQDMLGPDVVVTEFLGLPAGTCHDIAGIYPYNVQTCLLLLYQCMIMTVPKMQGHPYPP